MSDPSGFDFAPPPFNAGQALLSLQRQLRELGLGERAGVFERRGLVIARASSDGAALQAALVKRPLRSSPEWQAYTLRTAAEVRDFVAELKKRLARWSDGDE